MTDQPSLMERLDHHPHLKELYDAFAYEHLPSHLQAVSKPFGLLAEAMLMRASAEFGASNIFVLRGLEHLLEAKDDFVRVAVRIQHHEAVLTSEKLQDLRKQAIVDFSAQLDRICAENPMGVELPGPDEPFPGLD